MSKSVSKTTTPAVVARVQRAVAITNDGQIPKGSYVGRMQRIAAQLPAGKPTTPAVVARAQNPVAVKNGGDIHKGSHVKHN